MTLCVFKHSITENELNAKTICEIKKLKVFQPHDVQESGHKIRFIPGLVREKVLETLNMIENIFSNNEFIRTVISHIANGNQIRRSDQHRFRRQIPNSSTWEMRLMTIIIPILLIALVALSVLEIQTHSRQLTHVLTIVLFLLIVMATRVLILKTAVKECNSDRMDEARRLIKIHTHPWQCGQKSPDSATEVGIMKEKRNKGKQVNGKVPTLERSTSIGLSQ